MNVLHTSIAAVVGATASLSFGSSLTQPADLFGSFKPHASQTLQVAQKSDKAAIKTAVSEKPAAAPAPVLVTVQPGDYLEKIATENNTTTARLFAANEDIERPELIYPDQQLRVPAADEALPDRPLPEPVVVEPVVAAPAVNRASSSSASSSAPSVADGSVWDRLAACEAGGNWAINTGNGYYGGLQFSLSSWRGVGGSGLPSEASRDEQIMRGQMLQARSGWGAWPACSAKLGLR